MASLDDFFKKRDKKKKPAAKSKFSVLDTEDIAKQLEATSIKSVVDPDAEGAEPEASEEAAAAAAPAVVRDLPSFNPANPNENMDEEWKPFESDENKDYSGLRINIQNWKVEDEENNYEEANDENEKKAACPWGTAQLKFNKPDQDSDQVEKEESPQEAEKVNNNNNTTEETTSSKAEAPAVPTTTATTTNGAAPTAAAPAPGVYITPAMKRAMMEANNNNNNKAGGAAPSTTTSSSSTTSSAPAAESAAAAPAGKYIAPHLRNKGDTSSTLTSTAGFPTRTRPGKAQPNIMDTMEFPSLDNAVSVDTGASEKITNGSTERFEMAKKGGRVDSKTNKAGSIDLENKFTALEASNQ